MGVLESRLVIKAVDETAAAFASAEARVLALSRAVSSSGGMVGAAGAAAGRVAATERAITSSGAAMGAIASAAKQAAGLALAYGGGVAVKEAVKAVAARQHELVRMAVSGMSAGEISSATTQAAKLATMTPNVGLSDTLHMLRNARSIVGTYEEAANIAEPMLKLRTLAQLARPGQDVSEDFDQLIKGLEIKGVTQNPKQFQEYMQGIAKGINVFGDTLKPYQYYEMFKYGRQATPGLSEHFMLSTAPTLAQELGGSSYGKAVSAFSQMIVAGVGKKSAFEELARIGLVDQGSILGKQEGLSGRGLKAGRTVKGWEVAQSDPNAWVRDYLIPALDKVGIKDKADVMRELGTLFQNQMAGQMVSLLATQQSRIDKDAALIRNAPGLEAADKALREDPHLAWEALKASIESLTGALLQSVKAADSMAGLAKGIANFTKDLEEETKAQDEGRSSPGISRMRRRLNRFFFGVDSDAAGDDAGLNNAVQDRMFGDKARAWVKRGEELQGYMATHPGSTWAPSALQSLRDEARQGRDEWESAVRQRGEGAYAERMSLDGRYGRGLVQHAEPHLQEFISSAMSAANARAFGSQDQHVDVSGEAKVDGTFTVTASSELLSVVDRVKQLSAQMALNPVQGGHSGQMNSDAAPLGRGGVGHN